MAITQLQLYNLACASLGERALASLSEDREPRRLLDDIWSRGNGAIRACLEQGYWDFAMRAISNDASTSVSPAFGFVYAHDKPTDLVKLTAISGDETFSDPLTNYEIEGEYFYADVDPLYLRYVSDDASFGGDLSTWPESFSVFVGHWLGVQVAPAFRNDLDMDRLEKRLERLKVQARSNCAQQGPTRFPPRGSWVRARGGRNMSERGKRSSLIG